MAKIGRPKKPRRISTSELSTDFLRILVSKNQAARLLGVCVRTAEHLIESGELASVQIGTRRLISLAELFAFAERNHPGRLELTARRKPNNSPCGLREKMTSRVGANLPQGLESVVLG